MPRVDRAYPVEVALLSVGEYARSRCLPTLYPSYNSSYLFVIRLSDCTGRRGHDMAPPELLYKHCLDSEVDPIHYHVVVNQAAFANGMHKHDTIHFRVICRVLRMIARIRCP